MLYLYMAVVACVIALFGVFALAIDEAVKKGDKDEAMSLREGRHDRADHHPGICHCLRTVRPRADL